MKKILIGLGILSLLGVAGAIVAFTLAGNDIPPPDTSDLIPQRIDLPPEQNAYTHFLAGRRDVKIIKIGVDDLPEYGNFR
jgi:hypothetical protein